VNRSVYIIILFIVLLTGAAWAQWTRLQSSPDGQIQDIFDTDGVLYLAHFGNGIYRSIDSTQTWEHLIIGLNSNQAKMVYQLMASGGNMFAATVDGIYRSSDSGDSWEKKSDGIFVGNGAIYEFTESIYNNNDTLFTGAWTGIYRSIDNAETWFATNVTGGGIGVRFFINHNGILFGARENINLPYGYTSIDQGITWESLATITVPTITFLSEPPNLWAGTIHGIWLSVDNGDSWIHRSEGLSPDPYNSSIIRVNSKLITSVKFGGSGIFCSIDEGLNWVDIGEGLPFLGTIDKLMLYDDKIMAATGDGIWQRDTTEIATSIYFDYENFPRTLKLSQNYPNPFNASTTISYSLSEPSDVAIEIYDILGRKIETIIQHSQPAGDNTILWNAEDVSSGLYFYRIQAGNHVETKKMVLLQ